MSEVTPEELRMRAEKIEEEYSRNVESYAPGTAIDLYAAANLIDALRARLACEEAKLSGVLKGLDTWREMAEAAEAKLALALPALEAAASFCSEEATHELLPCYNMGHEFVVRLAAYRAATKGGGGE